MTPNNDDDLRRRFEALRDEDAAAAAPFERVLAHVRARAAAAESGSGDGFFSRRAAGLALGGLAAAALLLALPTFWPATRPPATESSEPARLAELDLRSLGSLRTPTDSLLSIPGVYLLGSLPSELLPLPTLPATTPRSSLLHRRTLS